MCGSIMEFTVFNRSFSMKHVFLYIVYVSFLVTLVSLMNSNIFLREQDITEEENPSPKSKYGKSKGSRNVILATLRFDVANPIRGTNVHVFHNAVPKTGSRTLEFFIRNLALKYKNRCRCVTFPQEIANDSQKIKEFVQDLEGGAYVRGHFPYLPSIQSDNFVYINIVRPPIERLISNYYYDLFGDGRKKHDKNKTRYHSSTLDDCLVDESCFNIVYSYYKQTTLRTFCGHDIRCSNYTRWTLNKAKENSRKYLFIGLTNQFADSVNIIQLLLPDLLSGLSTVMQNGSDDAHSPSKFKTTKKVPVSEQTLRFLEKDMNLEQEFYQFVVEGFEAAKTALLLNPTDSI